MQRIVWEPCHFTCSGEMNSPCAKVLPAVKHLYGASAVPSAMGPQGGRLGKPSLLMDWLITLQSAPSGRLQSRRLIPNNAAHCLGALSFHLLGRNEFALRQGFTCGKTLVRRKRCPICDGAPRRATGKAFSAHGLANYTSICSIRKASITSPSLMSWNFSKVIPHS